MLFPRSGLAANQVSRRVELICLRCRGRRHGDRAVLVRRYTRVSAAQRDGRDAILVGLHRNILGPLRVGFLQAVATVPITLFGVFSGGWAWAIVVVTGTYAPGRGGVALMAVEVREGLRIVADSSRISVPAPYPSAPLRASQ